MRKYLVLITISLLTHSCYAQFNFDFGGNVISCTEKEVNTMKPFMKNGILDTNFNTFVVSVLGVGILAYPKYAFLNSTKYSLSIGVPLTLGLNPEVTVLGDNKLSFMYDVHLALDINGGRLREDDNNESRLGYFTGIGLGFTNTNGINFNDKGNPSNLTKDSKDLILLQSNGKITDKINGRSTGILFHCGLALPSLGIEHKGSFTFHIFYKPALQKNDFSFYGGGIFIIPRFFNNDY